LRPELLCTGTTWTIGCTRGAWVDLTIIFYIAASFILATVIGKNKDFTQFWIWSTLAIMVIGFYMVFLMDLNSFYGFLFITFIAGFFFSTLPNTKLIFTNAVYYDEYLSGLD